MKFKFWYFEKNSPSQTSVDLVDKRYVKRWSNAYSVRANGFLMWMSPFERKNSLSLLWVLHLHWNETGLSWTHTAAPSELDSLYGEALDGHRRGQGFILTSCNVQSWLFDLSLIFNQPTTIHNEILSNRNSNARIPRIHTDLFQSNFGFTR